MSVAVSIREVTEIVNPSNITNWYRASLLTGNHDDLLANFPDVSGNGVDLLNAVDATKPKVEIDSNGFKCVRFNAGKFLTSSVSKPYNVDETFIVVCKVHVVSGLRFTFRQFGGLNRYFLQSPSQIAEVTAYTTGSIIHTGYSTPFVTAGKIAICTQRRASTDPILRNWEKRKYATESFTNTTYAGPNVWNIISNSSWEVSVYEMLVVNECLSDEKVIELMRSMSLQNGI